MRILLFSLVVPIAFLVFGLHLDRNAIPGILTILVGVAGAIFTIMSIWVAFLYPNVLKTIRGENLVNVDFSADGENTVRLKEILSVIVQSALTMIASIVLLVISSIGQGLSFESVDILGVFIQFGVLYFCGIQIVALFSTIVINVSFLTAIERQRKKRARDWDT